MSTSKNAPSAPVASPDKRTDELWADVERASPSSLIAGLPHISSRHPLIAILAGGSRITLADDRSIAMFELTHGTPGGVTPTPIWRTGIEGTVSALIGYRAGGSSQPSNAKDITVPG
ncbi:MAG: hypothetical protein AVDCRST_MAG43-1240 [uncultured Thermomicrobiales bacterium]|uniref:Uncharacterized protein n=1 Tax=uncultured Thermomicrobiales bacterium TaxID=1645740 RepID=A0A6J4UKV3_9BACT|nr:MAG: hypothetical protein AVDCRST_MAG43-1240 [uncultured Thermomicrobiales bacterium]